MTTEKVCYTELLPHEFRARLAQKPLAYLPLGTLEWHGEHLPLGSDAIISENLMIECAKGVGGIVLPPIHLGPDRSRLNDDGTDLQGMEYADTTTPPRKLDGSCYWVPPGFFVDLVDHILTQLKRAGFQAVFADGHGPSRRSWVTLLRERETRFGLKLFGVTEDVASRWQSQMDHAARNETSSVMAAQPDWVDLSQLPEDRSIWPQGVAGEDPRDATAAYGESCRQTCIDLMKEMFAKAEI